MADLIAFFHDAALTVPVDALHPIASVQSSASPDPVQVQVYLAALDGVTLEAESDPGVDPITISVVDADGGSGEPPTAIKLALTQAGLATAVAGDPLAVGVQLVGGLAGAVPIWVEIDDQTGVRGMYTDLSLQTNVMLEA